MPKTGRVPQVWDTLKTQEMQNVKISAVGMEDEYSEHIIELVTNSEGNDELLK